MKSLKQKPLARGLLTKPAPMAVLLLALSPVGVPAYAGTLNAGDILTIDAGLNGPSLSLCDGSGTTSNGSCFGMGDGVTYQFISIAGNNSIVIGSAQAASGSHGGAPGTVAGEKPGIDKPWLFFNNTGMHQTTVAITQLATTTTGGTLSFAGWNVTWNGIPSINMGSGGFCQTGGVQNANGSNCNGIASFAWDGVYGHQYQLWYNATVPAGDPSNFGGVSYRLHLVGKVYNGLFAADDSATDVTGDWTDIDVLANDASSKGKNLTSVVPTAGAHGTTVLLANGKVRYTHDGGSATSDTFTYTFKDNASTPTTSNSATVTVTIGANHPPVATDVPSVTVTKNVPKVINVLAHVTDPDNNLDPASMVAGPAGHGSTSVNTTTGAITYTPATNYLGLDAFTYTVADRRGLSATANVTVSVEEYPADWTTDYPGEVPILVIENNAFFTMELSPGNLQVTNILAGPDSGIVLGQEQYAGGTHSGDPTGNEVTGIDHAWKFFGNTGAHFTSNGGIVPNTAGTIGDGTRGTLNFSNRWFVTWNSIPAINMGGSSEDAAAFRGKAAISCTPKPCNDTSAFVLTYSAHVPEGDPSGFGKVPYGLNLEGHVHFLNKTLTVVGGTLGNGSLGWTNMRGTAADVPADTAGARCTGGCFDFVVSGVTGRAKVVLPLTVGIRPGSLYRKYAGAWRTFDTTTLTPLVTGTADTIKSAPFSPGTASCPAAGDASYKTGLVTGSHCVLLDIADNGPNDNDPTVGAIADPSGVTSPVAVTPPDTRVSGSSGCSLSANPVNPLKSGDWWLLLGFVAWMGFVIRRKRA